MKKTALKHVLSAAASLAAVYAVMISTGCSSSKETPAPKTTYTGTIYMASEGGGHIVAVPVSIDPSNVSAPITLTADPTRLVQLSAGTGTANKTHIFHDVRLDGSKLYYSAIKPDADAPTTAHLGYVDLANGNAVNDATIDIDTAAEAATTMLYCGSGKTDTHYFPMTMSYPAYIDAIAKSAVTSGATLASGSANVKRTYIEAFRADSNYLFAHGVTSPDQSKLFVAVNEANMAGSGMTGSITGYLVKTSDLAAGTVSSSSVTKSNTIPGLTPAGFGEELDKDGNCTIAFRSTFTPDGTKILQAGSDRLLVLNASDLSVSANDTAIGGSYKANVGHGGVQNHDVMPTPDGKYAILSLRLQKTSSEQQTSGLQLYDLQNNKAIGDPVITCAGCHGSTATAHPTCGIDGNLTAVTQ